MEFRTLEINVRSAKHLNNVNLISKMDVYVVVEIYGDSKAAKQKTTVDRNGDKNPTWNFPMKFSIDESAVQRSGITLVFRLRCERALGDKDIGEVQVPVKDLLGPAGEEKPQFVTYQVRKPSGKPKGELLFSYKWGDRVSGAVAAPTAAKVDEAVTAYPFAAGTSASYPIYAAAPYPAPPPAGAYPPAGGYPPPPPPPSYGYPPQPPGYGYPPPQPGYGYYPQVQQAPKKSKFGLGLGAGLLGGALGGLLIGDMVSDAAAYDAGYDAGFGDVGF